jgi:ribosomal protein L11 methyltransferase
VRADHVLDLTEEDALSALLDDFGPVAIQDLAETPLPPGAVWEEDLPHAPAPRSPLYWRVFFPSPDARAEAREMLRVRHPALSLSAEDVPDENWAARSQQALTAVRAGRFVVAPPWDVPASSGDLVVVIEPSRGFGTGHHPSTRLCLRLLSEIDVHGRRVLDIGTGSGVLAIAAALAGAANVVALDADEDAIDAARASASLNPLHTTIRFVVADFREHDAGQQHDLAPGSYDLVLANLTSALLVRSADRIASVLAPGALLIASGFEMADRDAVERAFAPLALLSSIGEDGWLALAWQRSP